MSLYFCPSIGKRVGSSNADLGRNTMNTSIMLFLAGFLYVAGLFVWRFRCMKGKHPNTDLLIRAWNSFSSSDANQMEGSN